MDNLPVIIANVQELDALCRAWFGYDSAVVERMEAEREYLLTVVEAARAYCASEYAGVAGYHVATENLFMALKEALAVYEGVGE